MKIKILSCILVITMLFSVGGTVLASYDPTNYSNNYNYNYNYNYSGENYYNYNYGSSYYGNHYMSSWAEDLKIAYDPTWYEMPQRQVTRGEAFLVFLRAVQRSLDRQGYSRLVAGYGNVPFSDYYTVNTYAQGEVNVLYANGILVGFDDKTMKFSQLLTRAEMAAIYSRFNRIYFNMGAGYNQWNYEGYDNYYNNNYNNYYNNYVFSDIVGHWAAQDIITAASNGVLRGMGNNYFDTEGPLTIEQVWKILDSCVGYQGLKRSDIAYAMSQTFKVKFGKNIDETYGTVNGTKISRVTSSNSTLSISEGETHKIKVSIYPSNSSYQKLNWTSSNTNYVSIEESWNPSKGTAYVTIYGRRATSNYITLTGRAMDGSGKYVTIKVKVNDGYDYDYDYDYDNGYITSIVPSESTIYLDPGESVKVNAKIKPSNANYKKLNWSSADTNIAYITDVYLSGNYSYATINANNPGKVYVTIRAMDGSMEEENIIVVVNDFDTSQSIVTSIAATPSRVTMKTGDMENIVVTAYPTNATDRNITCISDNPNVATVQKISNTNFVVRGVGAGTTNIRVIATTTGREIGVIPITITSNNQGTFDTEPPIVEVLTDMSNIKKGDTGYFDVVAYDDNLSSLKVYKSSILGITQIGIEITNIENIADNVARVYWVAKETCSGEFCIAAGVAVDKYGNKSKESLGVYVCVNPAD